ncbi:Multimeric flavodoxin WrbA [Brachyspira pilosicoli]|uniref:flavodoxin family protein n=1 Tax=Brachyspira pilosicoli TaxID=52584 RepID=UPI000E185C8D|nr:NAD(P)H-dependent oxidoreductase [Brachyspira pilosicoli]SUW08113.1 Multimeric flavodoxin WrbA [Brachyspira pilosicoli]
MKITVIHGQSHKGSTYNIAKMLYDKLEGDVTEFFLPRDFSSFCVGCNSCFKKSEKLCPHYESLTPITSAIDNADVIIFASPVYVYHVTAAMKTLLDHYGYRWMIHRPEESMFRKQVVCISTAAGGGMKETTKDIADSTFFWGVAKTYRIGFAVREVTWNDVNENIKEKIKKQIYSLANKIKKDYGNIKPSIKTKMLFYLMRKLHQKKKITENDYNYWKEKGWLDNKRPWIK